MKVFGRIIRVNFAFIASRLSALFSSDIFIAFGFPRSVLAVVDFCTVSSSWDAGIVEERDSLMVVPSRDCDYAQQGSSFCDACQFLEMEVDGSDFSIYDLQVRFRDKCSGSYAPQCRALSRSCPDVF